MKIGFLVLAAFLFFGAYRYGFHPYRIKAEFPEHPAGHSPTFLLRGLGMLMALVGVLFVYMFFRS